MATMHEITYRRLRAPRGDGAVLIEPSPRGMLDMLAENLTSRSQWHYDLQGIELEEVSRQAREELLREAVRWTATYREVPLLPDRGTARIVMAGHQPQLFHPGVWLKNFVLGRLAEQSSSIAVNLIVDSDTMKQAWLRVPGGTPDNPTALHVPLDHLGPPVPYEERRIIDRSLFASFGHRVARQLSGLIPEPFIRAFWPSVVQRSRQTDNLGACLAQARHEWEGQWGLQTLELPQSRICQTESFARLVAHLVGQLPRWHEAYNGTLAEYRRVHELRSSAQPMPDLATDGPWLEAPFWIWTAADPTRRPLFARSAGREVRLTDRHQWEASLPLTSDGDATRAVGRLLELSCRGVKIRSRALITTLWARLALGDLFLHGIGGAKYDQVTDALVERFFGLKPPGFGVVSGTLLLPVTRPAATREDVRVLQQQLRELEYHPEKHLPPEAAERPEVIELAASKRRWLATPQTLENARTRCRTIRSANQQLQPHVASLRQRLQQSLEETQQRIKAEAILAWREYAFCLFPESGLRAFLERSALGSS